MWDPDRSADAGRSGPRTAVGRPPSHAWGHRLEVLPELALAGPARRARVVPDRAQTADQMGRNNTREKVLAPVLGVADADDDIDGQRQWAPRSSRLISTPPAHAKRVSRSGEPPITRSDAHAVG